MPRQQLAGWITTYAQALQRSAMRSAMITGGAALAVVLGAAHPDHCQVCGAPAATA